MGKSIGSLILVFALGLAFLSNTADAQSFEDLQNMSVSDLANIDVTSVSKRPESLSSAAASVYVITHDEIMRSGATSLPEILRLAPNLQVAVINANSYAITARGFNGVAANKLLVLIDGRSVYTPLFGGVLWDEQDVPPEDIERIEIISGPGAALWGANAVNGVINIITRKSADTPGGTLALTGGNRGSRGDLQYGGKLNDDLSYRIYADTSSVPSDRTSTGADAYDGWSKAQAGFRLDWTPTNDQVTLQGDFYKGAEKQQAAPDLALTGGDVQLTWQHDLGGAGTLQILSYYDETRRFAPGSGYSLQTYDLEVQHSFNLGDRQKIVWGAGIRFYQDQFENAGPEYYLPARSVEGLADVFAQDDISLTSALDLTLGLKFEKDPYAGTAALPTARLSWMVTNQTLLWAAASKAVRAPTLFDEDVNYTIVPGALIFTGDKDYQPERVTAYELGSRFQFNGRVSMSLSSYYNAYADLRSIELAQMNSLPEVLTWGNMMEGDTYGLEIWGDYQPTDWWRLSAGLNLEHEDLRFKPGASNSPLNNIDLAGDDPGGQGSVRSAMNLGRHVRWNADIRYVSALPNPRIPAYTEADTSLTWDVSKTLQLTLSGANLLNPHHLEYEVTGTTVGDEVERSYSIGTKMRF